MKDHIMIGNKKILIDPEDYERVSKNSWHIQTGRDTVRSSKLGTSLHKFILDIKEGTAYHINGNPWNNRKSNLQECTNGAAISYMKVFKTNLELSIYANDHLFKKKMTFM